MKHYKFKDKLWALKQLDTGRNKRSVALEFYYNHLERYRDKGNKTSVILRRIERLFLDWVEIRDNLGMEKLRNAGGNKTRKRKGRPKEVSINDLTPNDREVYQKIINDILKDHNISRHEITERIKKEKENIENIKDLTGILRINRTNVYYKSKKKVRSFILDINLIKDIKKIISKSRNSIGRDKVYMILNKKYKISTYAFRRHWESLGYKSNYHLKYNKKPTEKKYKGIWTSDKINFDFNNEYEDQVWFSDITYIKVGKEHKMVLLIKDGFTKKIKFLEITENRKVETIINAVKKARRNSRKYPEIFHTDHGVEYANYKFKKFLERNNIIQSMSPKGNSLANRPAEYFFSILKREFIYPFPTSTKNAESLIKTLKDYKYWYHNIRVQRCLDNKTPYEYSRMMSNTLS
ncbi:IS3 family transposase, partial [Mycoplasma marinum]